ncbi:MAG: hypothetical protein L0H96_23075 [Humibacillus sp.]|nr:hypothetical protein [Humibacillus sp.]MDN5779771.1 hypothetical protein [Humibacillus sp.]
MALGFRSRVEHASYPLMERLNSLPRAVSLVALLAVLAVGLIAPRPFGGLAFLLVTIFVGWLLFLTWPRLSMPERMMRIAVLVLTLAVAVVRMVPGTGS